MFGMVRSRDESRDRKVYPTCKNTPSRFGWVNSMEYLRAELSRKLLGVSHEGTAENTMDVISITTKDRKEICMDHPLYHLACSQPRIKSTVEHNEMIGYAEYPADPSEVGLIITTNCRPEELALKSTVVKKSGLLAKFQLSDYNFPSEGLRTKLDLEITDDKMIVRVDSPESKNLRFDRFSDYNRIR